MYVIRKPRWLLVGSILPFPHFIHAGVLAHGTVPPTFRVDLCFPVKCLLLRGTPRSVSPTRSQIPSSIQWPFTIKCVTAWSLTCVNKQTNKPNNADASNCWIKMMSLPKEDGLWILAQYRHWVLLPVAYKHLPCHFCLTVPFKGDWCLLSCNYRSEQMDVQGKFYMGRPLW